MKKYELKIYPDPVLRKLAQPVTEIDNIINRLIKGMSKIMYSYQGIGLAAPQVGKLLRVVTADIGEGLISMINPEILMDLGEDYLEEGCLSVPDTRVNIKRRQSIFVRYINLNEIEMESEFTGLTARVIQHEVDHLNGILITDHYTLFKKLKLSIKNNLKYL